MLRARLSSGLKSMLAKKKGRMKVDIIHLKILQNFNKKIMFLFFPFLELAICPEARFWPGAICPNGWRACLRFQSLCCKLFNSLDPYVEIQSNVSGRICFIRLISTYAVPTLSISVFFSVAVYLNFFTLV